MFILDMWNTCSTDYKIFFDVKSEIDVKHKLKGCLMTSEFLSHVLGHASIYDQYFYQTRQIVYQADDSQACFCM